MSGSANPSTPRRQFLGDLALGAVTLAGTACATPAARANTAAPAPAPAPTQATTAEGPPPAAVPPAPTNWDVSWRARLTAQHKAVFDSPEIGGGAAIYHAFMYLNAFKQVYNTTDADVNAVLVLRHRAVPMLFNDEIWAKYPLGELTSEKDERTKAFVTRNPYFKPGPDAKAGTPTPTLESMVSRGVIILGCDLATRGFSSRIADKVKGDRAAIYEELKKGLVPGATLMPTGVFATLLCQESGCAFMRSS
jgi:hypothetical protein